MAEHTKGPWKAIPQTDGSAMVANEYPTGNQMRPKGLRLVCHVMARGDSLPMDEANARLIAAAPELLAASKALLDAADRAMHGHPLDSETWYAVRDSAQAAVAKADERAK